jgi:hypothetical protein
MDFKFLKHFLIFNLTRYKMKKIILVTLVLFSINAYSYSDGTTFHSNESYMRDANGNSHNCVSNCGETINGGESCMTSCT